MTQKRRKKQYTQNMTDMMEKQNEYVRKKNRKKRRIERQSERKRAGEGRTKRAGGIQEEKHFKEIQLEEVDLDEIGMEDEQSGEADLEEVDLDEIGSEEEQLEEADLEEINLDEIGSKEEQPEEADLEEIDLEETDQEDERSEEDLEVELEDEQSEETDLEDTWLEEEEQEEGEGQQEESGKRKKYKINFIIITVVAALGLLLGALYMFSRPKVVKELTVEAGSGLPELSDFLLRDYKDADFSQNLEELLDMNTVADYEIVITISGKDYTSILHVVDTTAPVVVEKEVQVFKDNALEPMDFIEKIEDATKTTVKFVKTPDFTVAGIQEVDLEIVDEGNNATRITVAMEILEDTEPPVIEGVEKLTVSVGESISYKRNVTVSDNYDENVTLRIDSSEVDLDTPGDYTVIYIAEDAAGNVTEKKTVVHVKPAGVQSATEEMVNEKADEILSQITTDGMSQREVAKAIFDWVHSKIGWSDGTPKTNWIQGAYRGLFERKGDCYVYASTAKCLLTRAGIANMDIGFSNPNRTHYWNLVDLGEGWYHFDATRRTDGSSFFYYSDADIRAYSSTHNGSHAYDPSQYPEIQ